VGWLNEYHDTLWLSDNTKHGDERMLGLCQPTGGLEVQVSSLVYELAATRRRPTFIRVTRMNSHNGFATMLA